MRIRSKYTIIITRVNAHHPNRKAYPMRRKAEFKFSQHIHWSSDNGTTQFLWIGLSSCLCCGN